MEPDAPEPTAARPSTEPSPTPEVGEAGPEVDNGQRPTTDPHPTDPDRPVITTNDSDPADLPEQAPVAGRRRRWRWPVGGLVVLVVVWLAAWGIDSAVAGDDSARGLRVAGTPVGGLSPTDLNDAVTGIAEQFSGTAVDLVTPAGEATTDAATSGLSLDVANTVAAVQAASEDTPALLRPLAWLQSLVAPRAVTPVMTTDESALAASPLGALAEANARPAIEPGLTADGAVVAPIPGRDGEAIAIDVLAAALTDAAEASPEGPVRVEVEPTSVAPRYTLDDAATLASFTNLALTTPIEVRAGPASFSLDGLTVAPWLTTTAGDDSLQLAIDPVRANEGIAALGAGVETPEVPERFVVTNGVVSTVPGTPAQRCCDPASYQRVADALFTPERVAVLDLVAEPLERGPEWAASLGIAVPVGTFTTNFPAGQTRAQNIIRIAEILQGTVIEPGATFSVNETTGPRGTAEGFVEGGVIVNGVVVNQVGGGISQFATTLFNAAFFAGLDIPDYMMHSLYISRYPYGREATLYYPSVDLKITNNTPYGILLWPTWTDDSITVTLYSSPWVVGEQTGQSTQPAGACTRVSTERTRTFLVDQTRQVDYFRALYQPEEGVRC